MSALRLAVLGFHLLQSQLPEPRRNTGAHRSAVLGPQGPQGLPSILHILESSLDSSKFRVHRFSCTLWEKLEKGYPLHFSGLGELPVNAKRFHGADCMGLTQVLLICGAHTTKGLKTSPTEKLKAVASPLT